MGLTGLRPTLAVTQAIRGSSHPAYMPTGGVIPMRWTLLLVPLLMASGCLAAPESTGSDPTPVGDPVDPAPRKGVVFFEADYQLLPTGITAFDVDVPEGARNVVLEMSVTGPSNPLDEAVVSLSGCGQGYVSWNPGPNIIISISGGGSWREDGMCLEASPGERGLEIDGGATAMTGRILLRADLP